MRYFYRKGQEPVQAVQINHPSDHPSVVVDPEGFNCARVQLVVDDAGAKVVRNVHKGCWLLFCSGADQPGALMHDEDFRKQYVEARFVPDDDFMKSVYAAMDLIAPNDEPVVVCGPNQTIANPLTPIEPGDRVWAIPEETPRIAFPGTFQATEYGGCCRVQLGQSFVDYCDAMHLTSPGRRPIRLPGRHYVFATREEAKKAYGRLE